MRKTRREEWESERELIKMKAMKHREHGNNDRNVKLFVRNNKPCYVHYPAEAASRCSTAVSTSSLSLPPSVLAQLPMGCSLWIDLIGAR